MKHLRLATLILTLLIGVIASDVYAIDVPHDTFDCSTCHRSGRVSFGRQGLDLSTVCFDCHKPGGLGKPVGTKPANLYGALNSITPYGEGTEHSFSGSDINLLAKATIRPNDPEYTGAYGTKLAGMLSCNSCHNPHKQPNNTVGGKFLRAKGDKSNVCIKCHNAMNVTSKGGYSHPINSMVGLNSNEYFAQPQYTSLKSVYTASNSNVTCLVCHKVHNGFSNPTATSGNGNAKLGRVYTDEWLCAQCHKMSVHGNTKGSPIAKCLDCHSTHNPGTNIKLVKTQVVDSRGQIKSLVYTANTLPTHFYNTDGTGLCQACHTKTKYFRNYSVANYIVTGVPNHNPDSDKCISCHSHEPDENFVAPKVGEVPNFPQRAFGTSSCSGCHGFPPNTGAHIKHSNSNTDLTDCAVCHLDAQNFTTQGGSVNHQVSNLTYLTDRTRRNLATFISKHATDRLLDSCGGASQPCHSQTGTVPTWGSTALSCDACHAYPPSTGNHVVHYTTNGIVCTDCHYNVTGNTTTYRPHVSVIDTTGLNDEESYKKKAWDVSYTYNIKVDDRNRNNGFSTYSSYNKSCSNVVCHDPGSINKRARWNVDSPSCTLCHGNSSANQTTGSHSQHLNAATNFGKTITCTNCHPAVGGTSYNHFMATLNVIELSGLTYAGGLVPGDNSFGSCGTNTCHNNGRGGTPANTTYTWGTDPGGDKCLLCHTLPPDTPYVDATYSKHKVHWNNYIPNINPKLTPQCTFCHTAGTATTHINSTVNVVYGGSNYISSFSIGANTSDPTDDTCQATCHSSPTSTLYWSASKPASCDACHGFPGSGTNPLTTGKHPKHFVDSDADYTECGQCHPNVESYTTALGGTHGDGTKNVGTGGNSRVTSWVKATESCTNTCHTVANNLWKATQNNTTDPLQCADCHGNPPTTGKHTSHVTNRSIACNACHYGINTTPHSPLTHNDLTGTATNDGDNLYKKAVGWNSSVYTRTIEVDDRLYNNGTTPTWASGSCATKKCHNPSPSGSYSANWTSGSNSCTLCHGYAGATTGLTTGHDAHVTANTNFGRNITCTDCHSNNTGNYGHFMVAGVPRGYVDFSGTVFFRYTTADRIIPGTRNTGYCTTSVCHNDGRGTAYPAVSSKIHWGTTLTNADPNVACNICHKFQINTKRHFDHFSTTTTAKYGPRLQFTTANCNQCHSLQTNTSHINAVVNFRDGGATLATTKACNNCHTSVNANKAKGYWTYSSTTSFMKCDTCHLTSAGTSAYSKYTSNISGGVYAPSFPSWATIGHGRTTGTYASGNPAANKPICTTCHGAGTWGSGGKHITNTANDFKRLIQATSDAQCLVCHGSGGSATKNNLTTHSGSVRFSFTIACGECHEPHGGSTNKPVNSNIQMIRATNATYYAPSATVVFTSRTYGTDSFDEAETPFTSGSSNNDDICATCHVNTYHNSRTKDGKHGSGNNGTDYGNSQSCTACHSHSDRFTPAGCNGCHGTDGPDGAPRTSSGSKYSGSYGAHAIHLDVIFPRVGVTTNKCDKCHGAGATAGTHTGHNQGGGTVSRTNVTMSISTEYAFKGTNPSYVMSTEPQYAYCSSTNCHFGPSPKWKCLPY